MSKACACTHVPLIVAGDVAIEPATCNGKTVEAGINLVVLILGEDTLIEEQVVVVSLVGDTKSTACANSVAHAGTADEVVATE